MTRSSNWRAGLTAILVLVSAGMVAQTRSGIGRLQITATVVSSSQLVEQRNGSYRLVIANAPDPAEVKELQSAVNRMNEDVRQVSLQVLKANPRTLPPASCKAKR
jgi:TolA-binding protein